MTHTSRRGDSELEDLRREWRVEHESDGSILVKGRDDAGLLGALSCMVIFSIPVGLLMLGVSLLKGSSWLETAVTVGIVLLVLPAITLIIAPFTPDVWLKFSPQGLKLIRAYALGVRRPREIPWHWITGFLLTASGPVDRLRLKLRSGEVLDLNEEGCITPPREVFRLILREVAVPPPARDLLAAEVAEEEQPLKTDAAEALGRKAPGLGYDRTEKPGLRARRRRTFMAAMLLTLALLGAWGVFGLGLPLWRTHGVVSGYGYTPGRTNEKIARRCVAALGGTESAAESLSFYLRVSGGSMRRRSGAAQLLAWCGPAAVPGLARCLRDRETNVVHIAGSALEKIGTPEALDALMAAALEEDYVTASVAIETLGRIGDPRTADTLLAVVEEDQRELQALAAEALGKIGDKRAVGPLLKALADRNVFRRMRIVEALGRLRDRRATRPLLALLKARSQNLRREVCLALGQIGDPEAVAPLIKAAGDRSDWVRPAAIKALGGIGDPRATATLVAAIYSGDVSIEAAAVKALGRVGGREARAALQEVARKGGAAKRVQAVLALGRMGGPGSLEVLIDVLTGKYDQRPFPRSGKALGLETPWMELLDGVRKRENAARRREAAVLLSRRSEPKAIQALEAALKDKDESVRKAAAEALKKIRGR